MAVAGEEQGEIFVRTESTRESRLVRSWTLPQDWSYSIATGKITGFSSLARAQKTARKINSVMTYVPHGYGDYANQMFR